MIVAIKEKKVEIHKSDPEAAILAAERALSKDVDAIVTFDKKTMQRLERVMKEDSKERTEDERRDVYNRYMRICKQSISRMDATKKSFFSPAGTKPKKEVLFAKDKKGEGFFKSLADDKSVEEAAQKRKDKGMSAKPTSGTDDSGE